MLSRSVVSDSLQPHGLQPTRLPCPWDSPGKNTAVGCHFLLQGIFLTQGSDLHLLCLLNCRQILYLLSHHASLRNPKLSHVPSECFSPPYSQAATPLRVSESAPHPCRSQVPHGMVPLSASAPHYHFQLRTFLPSFYSNKTHSFNTPVVKTLFSTWTWKDFRDYWLVPDTRPCRRLILQPLAPGMQTPLSHVTWLDKTINPLIHFPIASDHGFTLWDHIEQPF